MEIYRLFQVYMEWFDCKYLNKKDFSFFVISGLISAEELNLDSTQFYLKNLPNLSFLISVW